MDQFYKTTRYSRAAIPLKEREKSSTLLLLVKHFEIAISNCDARLSAARQAPHARFSTLASSRLAFQHGSIVAASSACEVQYPRLESSGFSARLHCSGKLRMRGSVPSPRVAWLLSPTPLQRQAPYVRFSTLASSRMAFQSGTIVAASSACEVQYPRLESSGFSARFHCSCKLRM
ncbi:unnamed protein product [Lactuca virosa]|uniref:Uncharacterized protein n=1 Tax=Lactuca virosa TaxID=75947 RepID=A0AAU9N0J9_9ASTR|nr:unnamed protein product [Lactuca virosa]